ncbi:MAG: Lrp/AsnC family transcriptional regulator [Candidatus Bathyarchaeia archaeon]|nr:Lrp/AsnC family transcriptional regulator [Candidatus Bathyarchaeota archaeon]
MADNTDLAILRLLQEDASISFTEIARRLKMSESTVRKRVEKLVQEGVIKKFTIIIEPSKIGLNAIAIVGIDVEPPKLLEASQKLCELPEVKYVATSTGDHMIMIEIWARDTKELAKIISEKIGVIDGVKKVCPAIILEKLKE